MLIYVEVFADESVGNVCLSILGFSRFKNCKTVQASAKTDLCTKNHKKKVSPLPNTLLILLLFFYPHLLINCVALPCFSKDKAFAYKNYRQCGQKTKTKILPIEFICTSHNSVEPSPQARASLLSILVLSLVAIFSPVRML